ncbi:MAG: GGDEF domain-containing protein [Solirubrobacterales bacterium]
MISQTTRNTLNDKAAIVQVRTFAFICFASAGLQAYVIIFPVDGQHRPLSGVFLTLAAGVGYWVFARFFRLWMLYLVVAIGFAWGCLGIALVTSETTMALRVLTILWTCVYVGASFGPSVTRIYAGGLFVGLLIAFYSGDLGNPLGMAIVFGATFAVTMEILTRISTEQRRQARTDPLTGLLNRNGLVITAAPVFAAASPSKPVAVIHADLDGFKKVNDLKGHQEGDRVLKALAESWVVVSRAEDLLARIGGDEFVAILPDSDVSAAGALRDRLRQASPVEWSAGIAIAEPSEDVYSCIARADEELYEEKQRKKSV